MKLKIFLVTFLFSCLSQAQIWGVGNGGGLAEMKALALLKTTPVILSLCVQSSNPCGLSLLQRQVVIKSLQSWRDSGVELSLTFYSDFGDDYRFGVQKGRLEINSRALYVMDGIAKSSSEIMAVVLRAVLDFWTDADEFLLKEVSQVLAENLKEESESLKVYSGEIELTGHYFSVFIGSQVSHYVAVEDKKQTHDFTTQLETQMACPGSVNWELRNFRSISQSRGLTGELTWLCEGTKKSGSGVLFIVPQADKEGLLNKSVSLIQIRGIIRK